MLIKTDRHTEKDLELWSELEEMDDIYYSTHRMSGREQFAIECIKAFALSGDFLMCVSWGKDSITALHLCLRALGPKFLIICAKGTYKTRAANVMYLDEVKDKFPGFPKNKYVEINYPEYPPHSKEKSLTQYQTETGLSRYISGIRAQESGKRKISRKVHGIITENVCRPIIDWPVEAVFAYCHHYQLPLHPDYGMLGGGRYERNFKRVGGSIGGQDGQNMGREEWEREYYPDVLARIKNITR